MIRKKRVRVGEKARRVVPMVRLGDVMVALFCCSVDFARWSFGFWGKKQELKNWCTNSYAEL